MPYHDTTDARDAVNARRKINDADTDPLATDGSGNLGGNGARVCLTQYTAEVGKTSEQNVHGGLVALTTAQPLASGTPINVTTGIGKLVIVVNAGSDLAGTVTVTGTSVDRDTGTETGSDTDDITIDALTTDASDTDANTNPRHSLTGAYITSKWFKGAVTISTTDVNLSDVDVYQCSFEQFNDTPLYSLQTFDINVYATNATAELDAYLYTLEVSNSKVNVTRVASINLTGVTASKMYRLRRGDIDVTLNGATDGIFVDMYNAVANTLEDLSMKVWAVLPNTGTTVVFQGAENLNDLADVNAPSPSDEDVLTWDDTTQRWIPAALGSGTGDVVADDNLTENAFMLGTSATKHIKSATAKPSTLAALFITGAGNAGTGTISNETYQSGTEPANKVLTAFESDDDTVTVTAEIHCYGTNWQPTNAVLKKDGVQVGSAITADNWTQLDDRVFEVTFADSSATASASTPGYTVETNDGIASGACVYTRGLDPPLVTSVGFTTHSTNTGGSPFCPYAQTQVKSGDTFRISGFTQSHATHIYVMDYEVSSSLQGPYAVSSGVFNVELATAGSRTGATQHARVYAVAGLGTTPGTPTNTSNTIAQDQTTPNLSLSSVTYPSTQEALKDNEDALVALADSNHDAGDTMTWDNNGQSNSWDLISNTSGGGSDTTSWNSGNKYYRRKDGAPEVSYHDDDDTDNVRIVKTRTAKNGASQTFTTNIEIADTAPLVAVNASDHDNGTGISGDALPRLGTDDGTLNQKDHYVYLNSDQKYLSTATPSLALDGSDTSSWLGSWSGYDDDTYRRQLRVEDGDISAGGQANNNFTWGACSYTNRAGKTTTTLTYNGTYSLGGFETRTITMGPISGGDPPYTHTGDIGVPVVNTGNCTVYNTTKGGAPEQTYEGSVTEHNDADPANNNYWTTVTALGSETFDDYSQYFHCSDKLFYESVVSGTFACTIAESA